MSANSKEIIPLDREDYIHVIKAALAEDVGSGDVTTECLGLGDRVGRARIVAKQPGVIAGLRVAADVFLELDPDARIEFGAKDGDVIAKGAELIVAEGRAAALLTAERTALNFLQRMSGIATFAYKMTQQVRGMKTKIYDTRKTTPGLRAIEKYAVRAGGGVNHRFGLFDAVLLKDNHIALAGGVGAAVRLAKEKHGKSMFVEVEAATLEHVREGLDAGADRIMLDNMSFAQMEEAVKMIAGRAEVEASGGVDMLTVGTIADIGVDIISVGALTHSADSLDIAMYFSVDE